MRKEVFENGVRFLYKYKEGIHSSFCIALEAGANFEDDDNIGAAHALEHVLFKGTETYKEIEINKKLDELFAMNNAMTNFPYVIFYGVSSNINFEEGFNLYSDIVLKPAFREEGFVQELSVIKEESREWKEDLEQYCEDLLLENAFKNERISNLIIGEEDHINALTIDKLKKFYEKLYVSENLVVSVVGSLPFEEAKEVVFKNFGHLKRKSAKKKIFKRDKMDNGTYIKKITNSDTCKIQIGYDISSLSLEEISRLKVFNMYFGEGVSSILYDEIRTKRGLAYEVYSEVKWEKGIRVFKIVVNTSKKKKDIVLEVLDDILKHIYENVSILEDVKIKSLIDRYKLKISLDMERSIVIANRTAIYETMYNRFNIPFEDLNLDGDISSKDIADIIFKVFKDKAIMILE